MQSKIITMKVKKIIDRGTENKLKKSKIVNLIIRKIIKNL